LEAHADDYLPEHALGLLDGALRATVEGHLARCPRCAARFSELSSSVSNAPNRESPAQPATRAVTLRLSSTPGPMPSGERFKPFVDRVASLFDVGPSQAQALLELLDDPACWVPGPVRRSHAFPVETGAKYIGALACFLRADPGAKLPAHLHQGDEHVLVLQGSFSDDTGVNAVAGMFVTKPKGTTHAVEVTGDGPCICCLLQLGPAEMVEDAESMGLEQRQPRGPSSDGLRNESPSSMPLASPAGPLTTLEEVVSDARKVDAPIEEKYTSPVLLVVAPAEGWTQITAVKAEAKAGTSVSMLPTIVIKLERKKVSPDESRLSLGRATVCDVVLPFSALSKVHAWMHEEEGRWVVCDAGSRNGTVVDGIKIPPNQNVQLRDGATLRFGDVTAKFFHPSSFWTDLRRRVER
jgi:anti-sigma factor ChrR (cupin superfamily)